VGLRIYAVEAVAGAWSGYHQDGLCIYKCEATGKPKTLDENGREQFISEEDLVFLESRFGFERKITVEVIMPENERGGAPSTPEVGLAQAKALAAEAVEKYGPFYFKEFGVTVSDLAP